MTQKLLKVLLALSFLMPLYMCAKSKCETFCSLNILKCLTVGGVNFSSLAPLAGAIGATGPAGAQGIAGVIGAIGAAGPAGAQGIAGVIGAAGAAGAPGTPGLPGIPGVGGILGWGYVYNLSQQMVALESPITFDTNGPLSGVTHTAGSSVINVVSAGTYVVVFSVSGTEPNQFTVFVNGVANTSTTYGSGAGTQQNTGLTILTLGAGDALTLVNHTSAASVTLAANTPIGGTAAAINASMLILRIA